MLLASITILLCFLFVFLVAFNNSSTSPLHNENARLRLALVIPIGIPITVANDAIEKLPLVTDKNIDSNDKKINKSTFYKNKKLFDIHDLDVNKILVSKKESYGTKNSCKYFIGYNGDDVVRPLCIKLPQMIGYVKHFDSNKTMSFKVGDNKLLKKSSKIWE